MKSLYLRIYLTVVAVLGVFALIAGGLAQNRLDQERERLGQFASERVQAWAALIENSLPPADAPPDEQRDALLDWSQRLRLPLAMDDQGGRRIATSEAYARREADAGPGARAPLRVALSDGRALWLFRPWPRRDQRAFGPGPAPGEPGPGWRADDARPPGPPPGLLAGWWWKAGGAGIAVGLVLLFVAIAAGAWPVVRRLTRRLERLQRGVEAFGAGDLKHRVAVDGRDEVAALATSFNQAAGRIETLLASHRSLLANASHELRSPLARLKMALALLDDDALTPDGRQRLRTEVAANIAELDALVEEVLLASRLDSAAQPLSRAPVDLVALAAEEAARAGAVLDADPAIATSAGDERLLRRALRNLLDNGRRYGGEALAVTLKRRGAVVECRVCDRGPGVPESDRERIFEPFFRLPGHAEQAGGVGLGLSLVRQIARAHGGEVRCEAREGGGSCFVLSLPV
jgi:signal transduction histidine kinase